MSFDGGLRMSWKRFATTISVVVVLGWSGTASALDDEYGRSGPYIGAGVGYAFQQFDGAAGSPSPDDAWGYHLAGGFRFNEYFALEVSWEHFPEFQNSSGDVEVWMAAVNGKFYPLYGRVQPYLAAGAGWSGVDDARASTPVPRETMAFAARFAGGLEVYITRNLGGFVEASYFLPTGDLSDFDMVPLSFGMFWRFF
jgi:hypothetical protein